MLAALLFIALASAQALRAVPLGATAITVMLCEAPDGCAPAFQAMADHCAGLGLPLLDFDDLAQAGPGGGDARARLDAALERLESDPAEAREALRATPLTLPTELPWRIWLLLGQAQHRAGQAEASRSLRAAASAGGGRAHDLPPLDEEVLDLYLDLASQDPGRGRLRVEADVPIAQVFVDGRYQGEAPLELELLAGWHRVSVERPGRRTAWTGEIELPADRALGLRAELALDDGPAALEAALIAATRGQPVPPETARALAAHARALGLRTVRFVELRPPQASGRVPEERVHGRAGLYDVHAAWLDVATERIQGQGPGLARLRAAADPQRFRLGLGLGYVHLRARLPEGPDPHDHLGVEAQALLRLRPALHLDARLGLWRAAQPWYLYDTWLSKDLVPLALGLRASHDSGLYVGAQGLAIIPLALGGQGLLGWEWAPSNRWRLGVEARGGLSDDGPLWGGGLLAGFAG